MVLKGFKERSNKKYLKKIISERQVHVTDKKISSLGVIVNIDEIGDFEKFNVLEELIKGRPNNIKIIVFSESKKDDLTSWTNYFKPKDFGWNGVTKNMELQSFLDTKFDVLISYYEKEVLELKLITAISKSEFKIGISKSDERINDLIIKVGLKEFDVFKKELFKYLTILNKI